MLSVSRLLVTWSCIIMLSCILHTNYSFLNCGPNDSLVSFEKFYLYETDQ